MPPCHFEYHAERKELRVRLTMAQLDAATAPAFKEAFEAAWKPGTTAVALDLSAVEFMDSSGVGALLGVQKRLPVNGDPVTLRAVRPAVLSVLELLRLQRMFRIE